jgi:hypothetical protein
MILLKKDREEAEKLLQEVDGHISFLIKSNYE